MAIKFEDRVPTYPNRYKITREDGTIEHVLLRRADEATKEGTPLNADNLNGVIRKIVPRNLLDNSNFENPVNQRGLEEYTGLGVHSIDRWIIGNDSTEGSVRVNSAGCIVFPVSTNYSDFSQKLENYRFMKGKTHTLAYKTHKGITMTTFVMGNVANGLSLGEIIFYSTDTDHFKIRIPPAEEGVFMDWIALYEGEYTEETFSGYQPKGFGVELVECQRYCQRHVMNIDTNERFVPVTVPMRAVPNVEFNVVSGSGTPSATVSTPSLVTVSCGSGTAACEVMLSADL